jgi:hypothetical protein
LNSLERKLWSGIGFAVVFFRAFSVELDPEPRFRRPLGRSILDSHWVVDDRRDPVGTGELVEALLDLEIRQYRVEVDRRARPHRAARGVGGDGYRGRIGHLCDVLNLAEAADVGGVRLDDVDGSLGYIVERGELALDARQAVRDGDSKRLPHLAERRGALVSLDRRLEPRRVVLFQLRSDLDRLGGCEAGMTLNHEVWIVADPLPDSPNMIQRQARLVVRDVANGLLVRVELQGAVPAVDDIGRAVGPLCRCFKPSCQPLA